MIKIIYRHSNLVEIISGLIKIIKHNNSVCKISFFELRYYKPLSIMKHIKSVNSGKDFDAEVE